jgi:hypothetical protein
VPSAASNLETETLFDQFVGVIGMEPLKQTVWVCAEAVAASNDAPTARLEKTEKRVME